MMSNHIHIIWQPLHPVTKVKLQHSFITFTAQKIKEDLKLTYPALLETFKVNAKDRAYQLWKRNALSVDLFTSKGFAAKLRIWFMPSTDTHLHFAMLRIFGNGGRFFLSLCFFKF